MNKLLSLLCLALVAAAPLSAATISGPDGVPSLSISKISDVCFGHGQTVQAVRESIAKAEAGVAAKKLNVGQGVDLVMREVQSGGGQCVAKTVLSVMREEGQLASTISVEDSGRAITIFVSSAGGPVLFKGPSEAGSYAFQVLTYRLQSLAAPAESGSSCHRSAGKDQEERSCSGFGVAHD